MKENSIENRIGVEIDCFGRETRRLMAENLRRQGLSSHAQIHVLGFLDYKTGMGERCSQTDIRRECCNTRSSSVTSLLHTLERDGFIRREPGSDARLKYVSLTEKGLRVAHECKEFMEQLHRSCVEGFTADETERFLLYLKRAKENLERFSEKIKE